MRRFLQRNNFEMIRRALGQRLNRDVMPGAIEKIRIVLEKHGEFYHPARIEAVLYGTKFSFVLNVAVSSTGMRHVEGEYRLFKKLNDKYDFPFLPRVYGRGKVVLHDNQSTGMFLGEWFEGYHEFHISRDGSGKKNKIIVWDSDLDNYFLSASQTFDIYNQAAKILTCYYDLETFEQIFPWHHAAGDFIVKAGQNQLALKLIAVRRYAALFESPADKNADLILQAMLIFLLNLSIRMRIDRLDGVGDIVWADEISVYAAIRGFFEGLDQKTRIPLLPDMPSRCFRYYLSRCTEADLFDLSVALVNSFQPEIPEVPVIKKHLGEHVATLCRSIRNCL